MNAIPHDPSAIGFVLARAAHFAGCLLLLGVFIFDRFVVGSDERVIALWQRSWSAISRGLVLLALPVALVSGYAWLGFVSMNLNELGFIEASRWPAVRTILQESQFGGLWKLRLIFWTAAAVTSLSAASFRRASSVKNVFAWSALFCAAALTVSLSRAGHGADGTRWHQAADAAHLLIGAAWPLGLFPLALLLIAVRRSAGLDRWIALLPLIQRFSLLALGAVILLTISGIINAWALVGSFSDLITTAYGQALLVKVSLFGLMILIGAINRFYLRPRLALNCGNSSEASRVIALKRLQLNVWIEVVLGVGVLLVAGLLGTLMPACDSCCCAAG
jgi:putative copper resistance protein D